MHPEGEPPCGSWVEITGADLRGPLGYALEETEHPARHDHPGVKIAVCALEAGHSGLCEMFVDDADVNGEHVDYWLTWERPDPVGDREGTYTWITAPGMCNAEHPHADEFICSRFVGHPGDHGMWL